MKTVLVTGGAGYIGSHCCKAFARAGWSVIAFDNLSRGWRDAVRWGPFVEGDVSDSKAVRAALSLYRPDIVAHFAAYAYVGESVERPEIYYRNNTFATLVLLEEMLKAGVDKIIFSSTCASYGVPLRSPIDEEHPQRPINPYGWSKFMIERMLDDFRTAHGLSAAVLRYFNAAGCDPEGEIGERHEPETHVIPLAIDAALRQDRTFTINGIDFDTRDGSAVRDYVHVSDLAQAHVLAGEKLFCDQGIHAYNLGTGEGTTVKELVEAVGRISGRRLPVIYGPRRPGDPSALVASAGKAQEELSWRPEFSQIDTIIETALAWHRNKLQPRPAGKRLAGGEKLVEAGTDSAD